MPFLSTERRKNSGMSDHEYASRFGWTVEFSLSAAEYLDACEHFESAEELEAIVLKRFQRTIRFRKSVVGRFLTCVARFLK